MKGLGNEVISKNDFNHRSFINGSYRVVKKNKHTLYKVDEKPKSKKINRNGKCFCNSGLKLKHCCINKGEKNDRI